MSQRRLNLISLHVTISCRQTRGWSGKGRVTSMFHSPSRRLHVARTIEGREGKTAKGYGTMKKVIDHRSTEFAGIHATGAQAWAAQGSHLIIKLCATARAHAAAHAMKPSGYPAGPFSTLIDQSCGE